MAKQHKNTFQGGFFSESTCPSMTPNPYTNPGRNGVNLPKFKDPAKQIHNSNQLIENWKNPSCKIYLVKAFFLSNQLSSNVIGFFCAFGHVLMKMPNNDMFHNHQSEQCQLFVFSFSQM